GNACMLDGLPRRFEQQPLLRIDIGRFAWRDAEAFWLELIDLVEQPGPLGGGLARHKPAAEQGVRVPALRRHLTNGIAAVAQQFPERGSIFDTAGQPTAVSDDCEGGSSRRHSSSPESNWRAALYARPCSHCAPTFGSTSAGSMWTNAAK